MKTNTIIMSSDFSKAYVSTAFMKKARVYGSREYKMLSEFRAENPTVEISVRKTSSSNNYNLTYANMEAYIADKPNAEILLAEFKRVKKESAVQRNRHLYVVNWFKEMFPNYTEAELFQKKQMDVVSLVECTAETADNEAA